MACLVDPGASDDTNGLLRSEASKTRDWYAKMLAWIIYFCYCPKHCFRLIEGQGGWSENLLGQAVV